MKRSIALIISVLMAASMAACGSSESETAAAVSSSAAETVSEVSASVTPESVSESAAVSVSSSAEAAGSETEVTSEAAEETVEKTVYDNSVQYPAAVLNDGDAIVGGTYNAEGQDESVLEASGSVTASVTGSVINKISGDASSADASSFEGVNSAVRVYDGASVTLKDCVIEAQADNATGVFAYNGGTVSIADSIINVTGGGAGGVQVAGGGILTGTNLTVTSASKAAIRSDRGGGTLTIDGGSYTSTGSNGCPAIYSTADITVSNADCVSENSRAVIIEGKNSVVLNNCTLSGNDQSTKEGSVRANVLLYQSMSGDASEGTSVFSMTGGSMKSSSGAMFYCTNTNSVINLNNAELELSSDGSLLIVSAGRWGKDGSNGGQAEFNAQDQKLEGSITVDSISELTMNLSGAEYTGAINEGGAAGYVSVTMDSASSWTLTGDSYISGFSGDLSQVNMNGFTLYINGTPAA